MLFDHIIVLEVIVESHISSAFDSAAHFFRAETGTIVFFALVAIVL